MIIFFVVHLNHHSPFGIIILFSLHFFSPCEWEQKHKQTKQTNKPHTRCADLWKFILHKLSHIFSFYFKRQLAAVWEDFFFAICKWMRERERNELESIKLNFGIKKRRKKRNSSFELFFSCETCKHTYVFEWTEGTITHVRTIHMLHGKVKGFWLICFLLLLFYDVRHSKCIQKKKKLKKCTIFEFIWKLPSMKSGLALKINNESTMISCKWDGVHTH